MKQPSDIPDISTAEAYRRRVDELEAQLQEARELLEAIRAGEVDAVVVGGPEGESQVYTLKDADRPYRVLIEQMREAAVTLSREGLVLYCNRAFPDLLGVPQEQVIGGTLRRFVPESEGQAELFDRLLAFGGKGELTLAARNGRFAPVQISLNELPPAESGGEKVLCAVVTDLTEEKRQAAELAEAQARLLVEAARLEGVGFARLILESATDYAFIATDLDGRITNWNTGACNVFGWSEAEVLGKHVPSIWTPEDRDACAPQQEMAGVLHEERTEEERWHLKRDGSRFWANGLMMPLRASDGRHIGYLKILRDRTETRAAEAALRESEARLRFTLKAGRLGAWELDLVSGELTASDTCRINFGRDPGEVFTDADLRASVHADDKAGMDAGMERSIADGTDYDAEFRVVCPRGGVRWVQIRGRPVYAEDGTPLRMTGVSLDVTDRRDAEDELRRLNETLESRVAREVAERSKTEEALRQSQKMEAVGQLTGGVAHDFNNLLTIIKSSTDLLRRPALPEERRRRYVDAIADTVGRASKLTGQLLAFARRQALKPEVFDVAEQLRSVADMLRTVVGSRIKIATQLPSDERFFIEADVSQFETALVNMAVNARDAMNGEGALTIGVRAATEADTAPSSGGRAGAFVAVAIADTGSGIAADKLTQIFEPFFTTKEVGKGTGLGLSQVYGFAKQSGGDVAVDSELGRGTTFTLFLPRAESAASDGAAPDAKGPARIRSGEGRRVLVVEDNVDVGTFSTQLLQDLGYETTWAANGHEALAILGQDGSRFDVVFSDVVMPGMGGVELGQEIRRRFPALPVVLTSGYSHVLAEEGRHGFELLQKPYAVEELSRVLRRAANSLP